MHDKPGAAQSGSRGCDAQITPTLMPFRESGLRRQHVVANPNPREDKGWTYGARSSIGQSERAFVVGGASVVTPSTAGSLTETFREFDGSRQRSLLRARRLGHWLTSWSGCAKACSTWPLSFERLPLAKAC